MPDPFDRLQPINIRYVPDTGGQTEQRSLPLKLLVLGDFSAGNNPQGLSQRKALDVNPYNFDERLKSQNVKIEMSLPDRISNEPGARMRVDLKFQSMKDFEPDRLVQQIEPLRQLLEMRRILEQLKMQYMNDESFRQQLGRLARDPDAARAFLLAIEQRKP